jgi:tetratricopeptide (TPR) repeat protein
MLFIQIGKAHEKAGDAEGMWRCYERAKQAGRAVGPPTLPAEDRQTLFAVVKQLGDHAKEQGDLDTALDSYHFYTMNERAGLETYRTLADLYERKAGLLKERGDPTKSQDAIWVALHCTEHALSYDSQDKDLLQRKDRYYYSITPDEVRARLENVHKWFDSDYCLQKTRTVLERYSNDLEMLDWAEHLAELVQAAQPGSLTAKMLRGRIKRVRGEIDQAVTLLEEVRKGKPEKFPSGEEEESWYMACRLLGEMYVEEKPDQAVLCLLEFRKSPKSGANTLYNLGRAYENLGDRARAARCYENVLAFEGNPLTYEAREALERLRLSGSTDVVS